ncbi:unnamed protein product [Callosobruchus maculatus]|uniref:Uncharacterized protein n=1 Tax=Callosobruchus maculatus TaxID=64391 RepID=A0A653D2S8_CALMS|nr:unnamed protein product [Callosobruchus maculatus]
MPKNSRKRRGEARHSSRDTDTKKLRKLLNTLDCRLQNIEQQGRSRSRIRRLPSSSSSSQTSSRSRSGSHSDSRSDDFQNHATEIPRTRQSRRSRSPSVSPDVGPEDFPRPDNDSAPGMPDEIPLSSAPLSEDIVEILGKKSTPPTLTGPKIHEDLVSRWKTVLNAGLSDDERSSLLSKLPPPENFQIVSAPRLNAVVQKALSPSNLSRDERLAKLQNVVAASLAGVGQVCSMILAEEGGETGGILNCLTILADY